MNFSDLRTKRVPLWVSLALAIVAAVCTIGWVFAIRPLEPVFGDVATWFTGLATVAAVVVALQTAHRAETRQERAELEDLRHRARTPAYQVSYWSHAIQTHVTDRASIRPYISEAEHEYGKDDETGLSDGIIRIQNVGHSSMSMAVLNANGPWVVEGGHRFQEIDRSLRFIGTIPPGHIDVIVQVETPTPLSDMRAAAEMGLNWWASWLEFTDPSGQRWRRSRLGSLEPVDAPEYLRVFGES